MKLCIFMHVMQKCSVHRKRRGRRIHDSPCQLCILFYQIVPSCSSVTKRLVKKIFR